MSESGDDNWPPLDEPLRIAEFGMKHWQQRGDVDRMLATKLAKFPSGTREVTAQYLDELSDMGGDGQIWKDMKDVMQASRDKRNSVPGIADHHYLIITGINHLFVLFTDGQDVLKQECSDTQICNKLLGREADARRFLQVCRTVLDSLGNISLQSLENREPAPMKELIRKVVAYVKEYMAQYDGSHDFNHIKRVLGLAHTLRMQDPSAYDKDIVTLAALLHDVGDRKYLRSGQNGKTMLVNVLYDMGAQKQLCLRIQQIVNHVSYSAEVAPEGRANYDACIRKWGRELEVVQDADRLDAIGAVGVGRCFAFGGSKGRGLQDSIEHFSDKLEKLQEMMKTELGRKMAAERTHVIKGMRMAWERETAEAMRGLESTGVDLYAE